MITLALATLIFGFAMGFSVKEGRDCSQLQGGKNASSDIRIGDPK